MVLLTMQRTSTIWLIIVIVIVIIAGVWVWLATQSSGYPTTPTGVISPTSTSDGSGAPMIPSLTLNTASSSALGTFLVAANGMTLYKYTPDTPGVSNCTGECAVAWPPYTISADGASATLNGATGISGQIGTITRADGTIQVTYNGMPLYFYAKDSAPGDTNGQGVGGIWFVVAP
jgi:predicted lipoprotein with Yx(FWY)xxD motif